MSPDYVIMGSVFDSASPEELCRTSPVAQEYLADVDDREPCRSCVVRYLCIFQCRVLRSPEHCEANRDTLLRILRYYSEDASVEETISAMFRGQEDEFRRRAEQEGAPKYERRTTLGPHSARR